jgi:phage protein D
MADMALFEINVGGVNVSEAFNQILESLTVTDKVGTTSDTASITLDDSGGSIIMPQTGSPMTILLGWRSSGIGLVFTGTVDTVKGELTRGGGRTLTITAKGFDPKGKAKQPLELHKDDATVSDFMSEAAGKAGLSFQASGKIGSIKRPYWVAGNESFIHLGQRIARELGGNFKIAGNKAIISEKNGGESVSGAALTSITAAVGDNLIKADISPVFLRPRFSQARSRFYDPKKAKWEEKLVEITAQGIAGEAIHGHRQTRADKDEAEQSSTDNQKSSERERGGGSVTIIGNPGAQPEGSCTIVGMRPGLDGTYKIDGVTHSLTRSQGYETTLELKHPEGDAGSDSRSTSE